MSFVLQASQAWLEHDHAFDVHVLLCGTSNSLSNNFDTISNISNQTRQVKEAAREAINKVGSIISSGLASDLMQKLQQQAAVPKMGS